MPQPVIIGSRQPRLRATGRCSPAQLRHQRRMHAGNGLTDPVIQYGAYADFARQSGLISQEQWGRVQQHYPICKFAIEACNTWGDEGVCERAKIFCVNTIFDEIMLDIGNVNYYDIRKPCIGPLCYDFSKLPRFLAQPNVRPLRHPACSAATQARPMPAAAIYLL